MKLYFTLLSVVTIILGIGCKKDVQEVKQEVIPGDSPTEKKWVVITLAGDGTEEFADGPALSAKFNIPEDVVVGSDGSVYVTDLYNSRIRKITAGVVSAFAGNSNQGIVNAIGLSSQFIYPGRMAIDANGNLYILDGADPRIRIISPDANVSTHAGIQTPGFNDGSANTALFKEGGGGIVTDADGNVYVSDTYNNRIRKINTSGEVTTIAGSGVPGSTNAKGTAAQFHHPGGIAIGRNGNLYVCDRENHNIRQITPGGEVTVYAGSGVAGDKDGSAVIAQFNQPVDMVIDGAGNLFVTDDHRIRKISTQGVVSTIAGSTAGYFDGEGPSSKFNYPTGMGIDKDGNIYVADAANNRIRKIRYE